MQINQLLPKQWLVRTIMHALQLRQEMGFLESYIITVIS